MQAEAARPDVLPLDVLTTHFTRLEKELRAAGAHNGIPKFTGMGSGASFNQWVKDLSRTKISLVADDDRMRYLTLQTLSGQAAEYAASLIRADPDITWVALKNQLAERYSDMSDRMFSRQKLKRIKQEKKESVQNYYQRLVSLAEECYPTEDLEHSAVLQEQLIEFFVDGLQDAAMAKRLLRLRPTRMTTALKWATTEQSANRAFELRRRVEVPMECDSVRAAKPEHDNSYREAVNQILDQMGGMVHEQRGIWQQQQSTIQQQQATINALTTGLGEVTRQVQDVRSDVARGNPPRPGCPPDVRSLGNADVTCFQCGLKGHLRHQCTSGQPGRYTSDGTNRPYCSYCHRDNHTIDQCFRKKGDEKRRQLGITPGPRTNPSAGTSDRERTGTQPGGPRLCFICKSPDHLQRQCPARTAQAPLN